MDCLEEVLEQLADDFLVVSFCQSFHGRLYEVELLLEVVEANLGYGQNEKVRELTINSVPVQDALFCYVRFL